MNKQLKPCPFCGSKWTQVRYINNPFDKNHVHGGYCGECTDCFVTTKPCLTEDEAIKLWNMRTEKGSDK